MKEINIWGIKIKYDKKCVTIMDSHKVKSEIKMTLILANFKHMTGYKSKRTIESWIREWKAHNRLYKLGLFRSHTKDCDLEEDEKLHRLLIYRILGI